MFGLVLGVGEDVVGIISVVDQFGVVFVSGCVEVVIEVDIGQGVEVWYWNVLIEVVVLMFVEGVYGLFDWVVVFGDEVYFLYEVVDFVGDFVFFGWNGVGYLLVVVCECWEYWIGGGWDVGQGCGGIVGEEIGDGCFIVYMKVDLLSGVGGGVDQIGEVEIVFGVD